MTKQRVMNLGATAGGALCAVLVACAGADAPEVSDDLAAGIADAYPRAGREPAASAGSGGRGNGGSSGGRAGANAAGGAGGATASNAGAAGNATSGGAAGSGVALAGAGGGGGMGEGGSGSGQTCNGFEILRTSCGTSGCHGDGSNLGTFAVSEEEAREFIDRPGSVSCSGQGLIIDTDDPGASLLVTKLSDDPPCGQPMPQIGPLLPQADIDCIEEWIGGL